MLDLDVELRFGDRAVRLTLATEAKQIGVMGPSGAGKTTLLRVLAGLERRARGRLRAFGETWQDDRSFVRPHERGAAWVPQESALFPHLRVRANLAYAGARDLDAVVGLLGVGALLDRAPRNLSGGERQRVALGRALLAEPRLLLLDEPFAALDRPLRERLALDLARWCRERSIPVVLVSHDEADLRAFGASVWAFEGGSLVPR
jgi:molybdate transport system ATP-binding protein